MSEWQKCPVCSGRGVVPCGFYHTGPYGGTTSTAADEQCRTCWGRGVIAKPTALDAICEALPACQEEAP